MQLENVSLSVALTRAWIWWGKAHASEYDTLSHTLMCGGTVTYPAYGPLGDFIGMTKLIPEQYPVATVTEVTQ